MPVCQAMLFIRIRLEMLMLADLEIRVIFFFFVISVKTFLLLENGVVSKVTFSEGNDLFKCTSSSGKSNKFFNWQRSELVSVPESTTAVLPPLSRCHCLQSPLPARNTYNSVSLSRTAMEYH